MATKYTMLFDKEKSTARFLLNLFNYLLFKCPYIVDNFVVYLCCIALNKKISNLLVIINVYKLF